MDFEESLKAYDKNISDKIDQLKTKFNDVYHIRHPFEINKHGVDGLYNEKLEDQLLEYQLNNLILKHFRSLEGFAQTYLMDEMSVLDGVVIGGNDIWETEWWFGIKRNGKLINRDRHPIFYDELHKMMRQHYIKVETWDF